MRSRCFPLFAPSVAAPRALFLEPQDLESLGIGVALLLPGLLHPSLDEVHAVGVDLRPVREESLDLHVDDTAYVDDRVRVPKGHEEQCLRLVRLEALLLPELRQHLPGRCVGVDRPKDDLGRRDVVGMVYVAASVAHRRIHGEDHVGTVDADLPRHSAAHVDRRLEVTVLEFEEHDVPDPEDLGGFALLRGTDVAETLAGHVRILRARRAVRDHAIRKLDAGLDPLRDGPGHAELGVVGVCVDGHRALHLERLVELHATSVRETWDRPRARVSSARMRRASAHAPGRINLIGEHTDYNDGLVLPVALRLGVTVETRGSDDATVRLTTDAPIAPREASYNLGDEHRDGTWVDRARGVTAMLAREGLPIGGFDAEISSDLPLGAGLGSSAAFAIALLRSVSELFDLALDDATSVRIAHAAETNFAGSRAGLLDQLASVYGRRSEALLIDMRDHAMQSIPLAPTIELAVIDSGTRHEHATGGYNRRREECEEACRHLGVASLRELDGQAMDAILERLPPPLDRRVRHVVTENARVREAVAALDANDDTRLGER